MARGRQTDTVIGKLVKKIQIKMFLDGYIAPRMYDMASFQIQIVGMYMAMKGDGKIENHDSNRSIETRHQEVAQIAWKHR